MVPQIRDAVRPEFGLRDEGITAPIATLYGEPRRIVNIHLPNGNPVGYRWQQRPFVRKAKVILPNDDPKSAL